MAANPQVKSHWARSGVGPWVLRQWQDVCAAKVLARDQPDELVRPRTAACGSVNGIESALGEICQAAALTLFFF